MKKSPAGLKTITVDHLANFISKKLLEELTGGDPHVAERCLACAQARQHALYQVLGVNTCHRPVDEEICLLIAVSWLYQYNGDHESDAAYYEKACDLIKNSYGNFQKQAGSIGLAAVCSPETARGKRRNS